MTNKQIAEKWYKKLDFPKEMQSSFRTALDNADIPEGLSAQNAPYLADLGTTSVVWALYFLENMEAEYEKRGVIVCDRAKSSMYAERILNALGIEGAIRVSPLHCHGVEDIDKFLQITKEIAALAQSTRA